VLIESGSVTLRHDGRTLDLRQLDAACIPAATRDLHLAASDRASLLLIQPGQGVTTHTRVL
jgi:hypothetical protein